MIRLFRTRPVALLASAAAALVAVTASPTSVPSSATTVAEQWRWPPTSYVVTGDPNARTEGITVTAGGTMYVSADGTGTLYKGHVWHPRMHAFDAKGTVERGSTRGVRTDRRGRVWSVGRDTLTVHSRWGRLLAKRTVDGGPLGPADFNDLVITRNAVFVTDWANPIVYRVRIHGRRIGELRPWLDIRSAMPGFPAQYWLLNGIVADHRGETLLVASNGTEAVWRVDTSSRAVQKLDVGGQSLGADGMVLHGRTLYAVINYGAPHGVYIVDLDRTLTSGTVAHRVRRDADGEPFDLPTAVARHHCRLYVVNNELDPAGVPPYTVSAAPDPTCVDRRS